MKINNYTAEACKLLTNAGLGAKEVSEALKIGRTSYNYLGRANFDISEYKKLIYREKKENNLKTKVTNEVLGGSVLVNKEHLRKIISMLQEIVG